MWCAQTPQPMIPISSPEYTMMAYPNSGFLEKVGITSGGSKAKKGTIAADIHYYPYGTKLIIPGYGEGVVEDTGSAIKGPHRLDVYFRTRNKALKWGRQRLTVKIKR